MEIPSWEFDSGAASWLTSGSDIADNIRTHERKRKPTNSPVQADVECATEKGNRSYHVESIGRSASEPIGHYSYGAPGQASSSRWCATAARSATHRAASSCGGSTCDVAWYVIRDNTCADHSAACICGTTWHYTRTHGAHLSSGLADFAQSHSSSSKNLSAARTQLQDRAARSRWKRRK